MRGPNQSSSSESCAINALFVKRTRVFKTDCTWKDAPPPPPDDGNGNGGKDADFAASVEQTAPLFLEPMP